MFDKKWLFTLACASVIGAGTTSHAQNTNSPLFTTPAERSSTTVPVLTDTTSGNSSGIIEDAGGGRNKPAPANAEAETPSAPAPAPQSTPLESTTIGVWTKECLAAVTSGPKCQITQRVLTPDGSQVILVLSMAKTPDNNNYQVQMAVPLGISLSSGIELQVGAEYKSSLPVARCTAQGCIAEGVAADAMITAMAAAEKANAVVRDTNGNPIAIEFGLDGFGEASGAL